MGYCIEAVLLLPDTKVEQAHILLPKGWKMVLEMDDVSLYDKYIEIWTDYFSGFGMGGATVYTKGENSEVYSGIEYTSINSALSFCGLKADLPLDGFDTIGLGGYRDNHSIREEINQQNPQKIEQKINLSDSLIQVQISYDYEKLFLDGECICSGHSINYSELIDELIKKDVSMGDMTHCSFKLYKDGEDVEWVDEEDYYKGNFETGSLSEYIEECNLFGYEVKISKIVK